LFVVLSKTVVTANATRVYFYLKCVSVPRIIVSTSMLRYRVFTRSSKRPAPL